MRGRLVGTVAVALAFLVGATPARAQAPPTTPPPPPLPKAWILVDADSGAVISAHDEHEPLPVASVFKVFTALLASDGLTPDTDVTVSPRAEGMPARKMNLKQGQVWKAGDLLHALLLVSANDAAVALAERLAGSDDGFVAVMERAADRLGLADDPVLRDPAGLDDEFSYQGGNLISARDLAIVTRAAMARPEVASIVALPEYRFTGGDGNPHHLTNHNGLLKRYAGAIGVKTGYTKRSGRTLIAAAQRDGRTMLAVVVRAVDTYGSAAQLLDLGFSTPLSAMPEKEHLPEVATDLALDEDASAATVPAPAVAAAPEQAAALPPSSGGRSGEGPGSDWWRSQPAEAGAVLVVGLVPALLVLRRRAVVRRRAARPASPG